MAIALTSTMLRGGAPAGSKARGGRWVIPVILMQALCTTAIIPISSLPGPELPALTPFFLSGILTTELATSFLLFAWFHDIRTWPLLLIASAYLFSALLLTDYLLTFPSAIVPGKAFVGGPQAAAWVFVIWTIGFAGLALAAAALQWRGATQALDPVRATAATGKAIGAAAAVALLTLLAAAFEDDLPTLMAGPFFTLLDQVLTAFGLMLLLFGTAIILLHLRGQNELFAWLAVVLVGMFCAGLLTALGGARYTIGWSAARLSWVVSGSVMFLFFVRQFVRRQHVLVDARQALEDAVAQRTADLTDAIRQRDLLLREVYHRVKNNLQVVDALIALEFPRFRDPAAREALTELRNRVFALGLVHQQFMSSEGLVTFPAAPFLRELCDHVSTSLDVAERGIRLDVDVAPIKVNLDFAIPVGLLTTTLLSNAARRAGTTAVRVSFQRGAPGEAILAVEDDGAAAAIGTSADDPAENPPDDPLGGSSGARIVQGLTRQLEGRIDVSQDDGVRVRLHLPLPDIAA
ncbi:MAG TPA: MASE4 domain-containing protein [Rhodopila sp.]|uniref:sensor histidine kinase n=1 Tax=Rhodopila sp. TaxID=2480087 RepID=UPI002BEC4DC7|nr:MASE4 domain-containing protein [Rhodopila sp.]HVY14143.1 MASE4 domain-containing protein [Rhodopila sp.]